jgi:hypothetical protein
MKTQLISVAAAVVVLMAAALPAQAALIDNQAALAGTTQVIDFEAFDGLLTSWPEVLSSDVTFTGDQFSELGANNRDLQDNGAWGGFGNHFAASGFIGELRFTFSGLSAGAGAFANHFALDALPGFALVVSAYGDNNQIIETHTVTIDTDVMSYDQGQFVGIMRNSADIRSISFKGVGVVVDNLAYVTPVPEPETYALMLAGLLAIGFMIRRQS